MDHTFQLPREFHTDLMSPSILSALKQPTGPYGTPVEEVCLHKTIIINYFLMHLLFVNLPTSTILKCETLQLNPRRDHILGIVRRG